VAERRGARRFLDDAAAVLGSQVLMTVLGIGTGVVTARMLGPHDRGLFQLLAFLPLTLANFGKLGIPQANVFFMRRRGASASDVASNSLLFAVVLGGLLALVCWLGRDWLLANVLKSAPATVLPLVLALLPFVLLQAYLQGVVQAQERFREYGLQQLAPTALGLLGMVIALVWLRAGLVGAVLTHTAIVALVTVWLAVRVHRRAPMRLAWNRPLARGMLSFGGKSYLQTLAATLNFRIDHYLIAYLLDPTQVGLYAVAANLTNFLLRVPDATGTVLFPKLAGASERDAHVATARVCRYTLCVTAALALGYACFGRFAIHLLYGDRFAGSVRPMLLMLPGILMIALYLMLTRNFTSRNRQQVNIVAAVAALAINVGLAWLLIPRWGIAGAAVSTGVAYAVASLILLVMFVRESGRSVGETLLVSRTDVAFLLRTALRARRPALE
jgi:O-antigen/teichoic acid export membrane protein